MPKIVTLLDLIVPLEVEVMYKYIDENSDGQLFLVVTMHQFIHDCNLIRRIDGDKDKEPVHYFPFRFNDNPVTPDMYDVRRTRTVALADKKADKKDGTCW